MQACTATESTIITSYFRMTDHCMNYFGKDSKTTTLTTGYSQGGAAARTYVEDYGNKQGLDYAVMLAPMGGNNGRGEDGIWGGTKNGVQTLGIENKYDPARGLWDA